MGRAATRAQRARAETITLGIAVAAIILFIGTGGAALALVVAAMQGYGEGPGTLQVSALLLNVALILFGWRRCNQLAREMELHRQGEAEALHLAKYDSLTGFLNRRGLTIAAEELIGEVTRRGEAVAVVMADLDSFKQINDLYGHGEGDQVLQECARRIAAILPPRAPYPRGSAATNSSAWCRSTPHSPSASRNWPRG